MAPSCSNLANSFRNGISRRVSGLLAAALACFIGSSFLLYLAQANPPPGLYAERPVVEFDDLHQGQKVKVEFKLVNKSSQPLEIVDVARQCGCTAAVLSKKHLEAGENTSVNVVWETGAARGRVSVALEVMAIFANGEPTSEKLQIQGNVIPDIQFDPGELRFGGDKLETKSVRLSGGRMEKFTLRKSSGSCAAFTAALKDNLVVEVTFDPSKPLAKNKRDRYVIVETDSAAEPTIIVPVILEKDKTD